MRRGNFGWLAVLPLFFLMGCGLTGTQQKAARQFARASAQIGDVTAQELAHMRTATIEMNEMRRGLGGKKLEDDLDKAFKPRAVTARVAAARAISTYGALLLSLVETSEKEALGKASDEFVASVRSASSEIDGVKMSDQQLEALGEVVEGVGGLIVEHKRAKAVKQIVEDAHDDVNVICKYLMDDLDPAAGHLAQNFEATISSLNNQAGRKLDSDEHQERAAAAAAVKRVQVEKDRLETMAAQMKTTLGQLIRANDELASVLQEEPSLREIAELGKQIGELGDSVVALTGK